MLVLANAGVPMIAWQFPLMVLLLIPVIVIETIVSRGLVHGALRNVVKGVAAANVCSTLVGIPLAWGAMLGMNILTTGTKSVGLASPMAVFKSVVLQSSWLVPYEDDLYWMIPLATLVLLLPYFLVSVYTENRVLRRMWNEEPRTVVSRVAWLSNTTTYLLFLIATLVWLFSARP
jgi:hypothetical protein